MRSGANVCKSCRSRQELSNEYLLAKIRFDIAENEPLKVCWCIHAPLTPGHKFCSAVSPRAMLTQMRSANPALRRANSTREVSLKTYYRAWTQTWVNLLNLCTQYSHQLNRICRIDSSKKVETIFTNWARSSNRLFRFAPCSKIANVRALSFFKKDFWTCTPL